MSPFPRSFSPIPFALAGRRKLSKHSANPTASSNPSVFTKQPQALPLLVHKLHVPNIFLSFADLGVRHTQACSNLAAPVFRQPQPP